MSGQINRGSELGEIIYNYATSQQYKNFLEIGTWNGQGSTKCFIDGLITRNDDYTFISLESSKKFYDDAIEYHKNNLSQQIQIIYGKIIDENELIHSDIQDFRKKWLLEDINNYKICINVWNKIYKQYDVVLLDGGEFSTFSEFNKLRNLTKIFILDDIFELKNKEVVAQLDSDNLWQKIIQSTNRNGYAIYERLHTNK